MVVALRGESVTVEGEKRRDCGIRRRRRLRTSLGLVMPAPALVGVGGGRDAAENDLSDSLAEKEPLIALAGWDVGEMAGRSRSLSLSLSLSRGNLGKLMLALTGLLNTGVRALRNSVYAAGGVIGVGMSSSCFTLSEREDDESLKSSDGKTVVLGVFSG